MIDFIRYLENSLNCEVWIVGGYNRDQIFEIESKDIDLELYNTTPNQLEALLPNMDMVGRAFGSYYIEVSGTSFNISFPRTEILQGKGWDIDIVPDLDKFVASKRRDFTMNAIMFRPTTDETLDFFGGIQDAKEQILKIVNFVTFQEDPLRVLRAFSLASRFNLKLTEFSILTMQKMISDFDTIPIERLWTEWEKWSKASFPTRGLRILVETGWIKNFPWLYAMLNIPQDPVYHPEGDLWTHTLKVCERLAGMRYLTFAGLLHDSGKAFTSIIDKRVSSPNHAFVSSRVAWSFMNSINAPHETRNKVVELCEKHMFNPEDQREVNKLLLGLKHVSSDDLIALKTADKFPRVLNFSLMNPIEPLLRGRDIINFVEPGPKMGSVLRAVIEAQIKEEVKTKEEAIAWARTYYDNNL